MATVQELQNAIDLKKLDVNKLNDQQKGAIDVLLQKGDLKGYNSVREIEVEQEAAREIIASKEQQRLEPFQTATGIERKDLELVGDVTGTLIPYVKNKDMLVKSLIANNGKAEFNVDQRAIIKPEQLSKAQRYIAKLPVVRGSKLLARAGNVLGKMIDFVRQGPGNIRLKGPTPFLYTEALSQFGGSVGAGLGSLTYDAANLMTDFAATTSEDLANITDDDIRKLPVSDRAMVHAADAMKNALYFNFGAFSIAPMLGLMTKGFRSSIGLEGEKAYELAKTAREEGLPINYQGLIDESKGFIAKGLKDLGRTITVIPTLAGPPKAARIEIERATYKRMLDYFDASAPYADAQLLSYGAVEQVKKNFKEMYNLIDARYTTVMRNAENIGGGKAPFIKLDNFMKEAQKIKSYFEQTTVGMDFYDPRLKGLDIKNDPILKYIQGVQDSYNMRNGITAPKYVDFHRQLKQAYQLSDMQNPTGIVARLDSALKKDLNSVMAPQSVDDLLQNSEIKAAFDEQVSNFGPQAGQKYLTDLIDDMKAFQQELMDANEFFTRNIRTYKSEGSALMGTKTFKKFDSNIFTQKGLLNVAGRSNLDGNRIFEDGLLNAFKNGSDGSIRNIKKLLGMDRGGQTQETGTKIFDRFRTVYMFDAYNDAFDMKPILNNVPLFKKVDEMKARGMIKSNFIARESDKLTAQDMALAGLDPDKLMKSGLTDIGFDQLRLKADEVAQFNPAKFRQNLGLTGTSSEVAAARNRLVEMYGGGAKGNESVKRLERIIDVMDGQYSYELGDASTYLKRSIQIGGMRRVMGAVMPLMPTATAGLGVATMGFLPTLSFILLGRKAGAILGNSKGLEKFYDTVYDPLVRMDQLSGTGEYKSYLTQPMTKAGQKSFADLYNYVMDEDKDAPKVVPGKIDFEEVTRYLLSTPTTIPRTGFSIEDITNDIRNRMYPELNQIKNSTTEELINAENYIKGNMIAADQNEAADRIDNEVLNYGRQQEMNQTGGQLPVGNVAPVQPVQPVQPVERAATFKALNPFDTLGQAIAEREQG